MINFFLLALLAVTVFGVPIKGSFASLTLAALIFVVGSTGFGLLASTFTNSQIAAMFVTMIIIACSFPACSTRSPRSKAWVPGSAARLSGHSFFDHQPGRVQQGPGPERPDAFVLAAAGGSAGDPRPGYPAAQKTGGLKMHSFAANIYRLGIKELWSLVRDPMMLVLIVYTFTVSIYVAATAMPESLVQRAHRHCRRGWLTAGCALIAVSIRRISRPRS